MKKILSVNATEKLRILEMHGFINKPNVINESNVINEQIKELETIFVKDFVKGLEKSDIKAFDELGVIIGKKADETLSGAFDRVLSLAITTGGRQEGAKVMQFCRKLSSVNDKFAEEFYKTQTDTINKLKQKYPADWEKLVKTNFGEEVLEKAKKGTSSSSSSSKIDELGIAGQIQNYLNNIQALK
jgi:hypothetical protein